MKKITGMLLAVMLLLCSCDSSASTTPSATQPTQEQTQPTEPAPITTEEALQAALVANSRVTLEGDIQLTEALVVSGRILDGGGHTITGMEYVEDDATTENAVMIASGTVQNLNVVGAYRCLGDCADYPMQGDVRIKNVYADGTTLALSMSKGSGQYSMYVEDCTLRGWTLVNKMKEVQFTNCTFGWNSNGTGGHLRNYVNTTLIGCRFEGKENADGTVTRYNISFYKSTKGVILTLEDCYVGDTLITQENVTTLLKVSANNNTVIVRNSGA